MNQYGGGGRIRTHGALQHSGFQVGSPRFRLSKLAFHETTRNIFKTSCYGAHPKFENSGGVPSRAVWTPGVRAHFGDNGQANSILVSSNRRPCGSKSSRGAVLELP